MKSTALVHFEFRQDMKFEKSISSFREAMEDFPTVIKACLKQQTLLEEIPKYAVGRLATGWLCIDRLIYILCSYDSHLRKMQLADYIYGWFQAKSTNKNNVSLINAISVHLNIINSESVNFATCMINFLKIQPHTNIIRTVS